MSVASSEHAIVRWNLDAPASYLEKVLKKTAKHLGEVVAPKWMARRALHPVADLSCERLGTTGPRPPLVQRPTESMLRFQQAQDAYDAQITSIEARFTQPLNAADFMQYCTAMAPEYSTRSASLLAVEWPAEAIASVQRLANEYEVASGFYSACAGADRPRRRYSTSETSSW